MTSPRFDMYAFIHKALRAMMAETLVAIGRMDVHDADETAARLAQLRELLAACASHLEHEDHFIHPALEARTPGASRATADDHGHHAEALVALEWAAQAVEQATSRARPAAAHALYLSLAGFVADNYQHMQVEERDNNAALQAAYTDAELIAIHDALVASIPPQEMAATLRWMLPNMAAGERAGLLGALAQSMPKEGFDGVLMLARQHLTARDWFKLMTALAPMPLAA